MSRPRPSCVTPSRRSKAGSDDDNDLDFIIRNLVESEAGEAEEDENSITPSKCVVGHPKSKLGAIPRKLFSIQAASGSWPVVVLCLPVRDADHENTVESKAAKVLHEASIVYAGSRPTASNYLVVSCG